MKRIRTRNSVVGCAIIKRATPRGNSVAEFVSKRKGDRQRDYQEKPDGYMAIGVSEYWIIDRFRRIMTVIRNQPGGPVEIVVQENETYRAPLLPGFELPPAKLLAVGNCWGAPEVTPPHAARWRSRSAS